MLIWVITKPLRAESAQNWCISSEQWAGYNEAGFTTAMLYGLGIKIVQSASPNKVKKIAIFQYTVLYITQLKNNAALLHGKF